MNIVFYASNLAVLPFWGLMILAPRWAFTRKVINSPCICVPFAVLYTVLFVLQLPMLLHTAALPTFASVQSAMCTRPGTNLAWAHYLTFDLFVGRWIFLDSRDRDIHRAVLTVVFLVALTFGPLAFLAYIVLRSRRPARTPTPVAP